MDKIVNAGARPLLATFADPRTGSADIPGHYCPKTHVWVFETPEGAIPLVQANSHLLETVTKTMTVVESDDAPSSPLLEMVTKTAAQIESDDQRPQMSAVLDPISLTVRTH